MLTAKLSMMMFLQFFLWGAWYVTMGPYMNASGMAPETIGTAYALGPIAAIISPFFLGLIADRFFPTQIVLGAMHLIGGVLLLLAPLAAGQSANLFLAAVLLHMLCYMPTLGLTNTLSFRNMANPERQFPLIRVWGTIGWIVAGFVISGLKFDVSASMFYVAGASGIAMGAFSFLLPSTPAPSKGKPFSVRDALGLDTLAMMKDRSFAVFVICSLLVCIPLAAYYSFAGQFIGEVGFKSIGSTMSFGQMSEIVFMLVMPLFFVRLGVKWMLLIGMGAWVLRYLLFAQAWDSGGTEHVKWMVLSGIILHGICYDFFFVTGFIYAEKKAKPEHRGAVQGFLVLITQGLGMFIGAKAAGRLVGHYTTTETTSDGVLLSTIAWDKVWLAPALFAAAVMVVFFLFFHDKVKPSVTDVTEHTPEGDTTAEAETAV
ncbi:MAG: MFS transporter [Planctomycetota bacterium]|nr:MFS transporter [Planctomycetota bacterium]